MSLIASVYRQFHKPTGFLGRLAGRIMTMMPGPFIRIRPVNRQDFISADQVSRILEASVAS
jgi:hypothetical protein